MDAPGKRYDAMSEPAKNPFDLLLDQIRVVVREEIAAARINGAEPVSAEKETWLTAEQAAAIIGVNKERVYQYAKRWTFAKKISHKALRINEAGLRRWLAARK